MDFRSSLGIIALVTALPITFTPIASVRPSSACIAYASTPEPITCPWAPTLRSSAIARSPVPVATSSARSPGPTPDSSTARRRQRWCIPAVMTEFMRS